MATRIAMADVRKVPERSGRMPKCFWAKRGVHWVSVRNSRRETSAKNSTVSKMRTATMPNVVKRESAPQTKKPSWRALSPTLFLLARSSIVAVTHLVSYFASAFRRLSKVTPTWEPFPPKTDPTARLSNRASARS